MSANVTMKRTDAAPKSILVAYILWFFLGWFGVHRFYVGRAASGTILFVITVVSFALIHVSIGLVLMIIPIVWLHLDAFYIPGMVNQANNQPAKALAAGAR
jgi:TM2 domain-containing membrane protein YozV